MASFSSCEFIVKLKNKKKIKWEGENGERSLFFIPQHAEQSLKAIASVPDLISFVQLCIAADGVPEERVKEIYEARCAKFNKQLLAIEHFDDISDLSMSWGEYDPSEGYPEDACTGQSLSYSFKTGAFKASFGPDPDFINDVSDVFGDMLEE